MPKRARIGQTSIPSTACWITESLRVTERQQTVSYALMKAVAHMSSSRPDERTALPSAIPPIARKTILQGEWSKSAC